MPNWFESMQQTYEYYEVDPTSWTDIRKIDNVISSDLTRDSEVETLGSASFEITDSVGECYIRVYLVTIQNGVTEKHPLGTYIVQTPNTSFDGMIRKVQMDAYTPLIELKEKMFPIGYYIKKNSNIMEEVYDIVVNNTRAPVVNTQNSTTLVTDYIYDPSETVMTFTKSLLNVAKYSFDIDEMGNIMFSPKQEISELTPVMTFDDGNSSILYSDVSLKHDLYGIPNVVEVVYSTSTEVYSVIKKNEDNNSPTSIQNRGRELWYRELSPSISLAGSTAEKKAQLNEYAEELLRRLSTLEYEVTYTHAYYPVRVGDCVRLNYERAGLTNINAKIIRQTIKCEPGCPVNETAVFTTKLWG